MTVFHLYFSSIHAEARPGVNLIDFICSEEGEGEVDMHGEVTNDHRTKWKGFSCRTDFEAEGLLNLSEDLELGSFLGGLDGGDGERLQVLGGESKVAEHFF